MNEIDRLTARLNELHLSDTEFARVIGVTRAHVYNWKKRGSIPGNRLPTIAAVLGVSVDWLLGGNPDGDQAGTPSYGPDISFRAIEIATVFDQLPAALQDYVADIIGRCKRISSMDLPIDQDAADLSATPLHSQETTKKLTMKS